MTHTAPGDDGCWRTIGVWAPTRPSCALLEQHVHCHNCPIFAAAGRALLDRDLTPDQLAVQILRVAEPAPSAPLGTVSILRFHIGDEQLALATGAFAEVAHLRPIHHIPHVSDAVVRGLVNVGGRLLLCVSLGNLLRVVRPEVEEAPEAPEDSRGAGARLLVMEHEDGPFAFPVSSIAGVDRYHADELRPRPATLGVEAAGYALGVIRRDGEPVGVLDAERVRAGLAATIRR